MPTDVPGGLTSSGALKGANVYNTEGEHIAIIHDVMLDTAGGRISSVILAIGTILGMGGEHQEVPWHSLSYDPGLDGYVLGIPLRQMQDAPEDPEEEEDTFPLGAVTRLT